MTKRCASCKIEKEHVFFSKDRQSKDMLSTYCRECRSLKNKQKSVDRKIANERNRNYYNTTRSNQYRKDPAWYLWSIAQKRARKLQIPFTITKEDIQIPERCPITGDLIDLLISDKKQSYQTGASLDKVDNSLGYIPGNVRVISRKANRMKSDLSIEQLETLLKYMKGEI